MNNKNKTIYITPSKLTIIGLDKINVNHKIHYLIYKITFKNNNFYYIGQHKTKNPLDNYAGSGKLVNLYKEKYGLANMIKEILFDFDNVKDMDKAEYDLIPIDINGCHDELCLNLMEGGHSYHITNEIRKHLSKLWHEKPNNEKQRIKEIITQKNKEYWNNKSEDELNEWKEFCRQKNIGENNPMYGEKLKNHMTVDAYEQLIEKLRINQKKSAKELGKKRTGKTFEDLYGIDKAAKIKQKMHNSHVGKKGYDITQFMTLDEIQQWKQKISNANSGKNNSSYGKCWIYNSQTNEQKYIKSEDLQKYIFDGSLWNKGILPNRSKKSGKTFSINRLKQKYPNINFDEFDYEQYKMLKGKDRQLYIEHYVLTHTNI